MEHGSPPFLKRRGYLKPFNVMNYEYLSHTADIKFQAFGKNIEECFTNAVYALTNIICKQEIKGIIKKSIKAEGDDLEELLYNFLEEFLFLSDSQNFLFSKFKKIKIYKKNGKFNLNSEVLGDDSKKYQTELDVKAITYNEMFVIKDKDSYKCQVVVDV